MLGQSVGALRVPAALCGTAIVALAAALRRSLGATAALTAGVLLAVSPTLLYYARFAREEMLLCALTLAFVVACAHAARGGVRPWHPPLLGALLAACFGTKEATFLQVPIGVVAGGTWYRLRRPRLRLGPPGVWLAGVATFAVVFVAIFTQLGRHWDGVADGAWNGLVYWAREHGRHRGGYQPSLYALLLVLYELPLLLLGLWGAWWSARRRHAAGCGIAVAFALTFGVYSFAGERFPWLMATQLVELALLAGLGFAALRPSGRVIAAGLAVVFLAWTNLQVQALHPNSASEPMAIVPTDGAVERVTAELQRARPSGIAVDGAQGSGSPWSWYLRDLPAGYYDMRLRPRHPDAPAAIVSAYSAAAFRGPPGARVTSFAFREGWPRPTHGLTPAGLVRWYLHRTPWSPLSPEREQLYVAR